LVVSERERQPSPQQGVTEHLLEVSLVLENRARPGSRSEGKLGLPERRVRGDDGREGGREEK
jgi:hypothetical protein